MIVLCEQKDDLTQVISWIGICAVSCCLVISSVECFPAESKYNEEADVNTLVYMQFLHRHGDRSPIFIYPTDPYDSSYWPQGLGELTTKGIRRMYEVGKFLRHRYSGFLNSSFYDNQINVKSTSTPRAVMSAQALLAGLYRPEGSQIWNEQLLWQPIPVYVDDSVLGNGIRCPRYENAYEQMLTEPITREIQSEFAHLCEYVSVETGNPLIDRICLLGVSTVYDTLLCEDDQGYILPNWTANVYPEPMKQIHDWFYVYSYFTTEMAKLKSGHFLYNVVQNIHKYRNGEMGSLRVQHYSGHDTTIAALMSLLGVNNKIAPPFSATLLMELHRYSENEYAIKFFYYNETDAEPYPIQLPNCEFACPLDEFYRITEPLVVEDPEKECNLSDGR